MRNGYVGIRLQNDYGCRWPIWWVGGLQAEIGHDLEVVPRLWELGAPKP